MVDDTSQQLETTNSSTTQIIETTTQEVTTIENRYYISSKYIDIQEFNNATRGHWNIEKFYSLILQYNLL